MYYFKAPILCILLFSHKTRKPTANHFIILGIHRDAKLLVFQFDSKTEKHPEKTLLACIVND